MKIYREVKSVEELIRASAYVKVLHRLMALKEDEPNLHFGDDYHLSPYSLFKEDGVFFVSYKVRQSHDVAMQKLKPDINMILKESVGRNNHKIKFTRGEDIDEDTIYAEMFEKFCKKNKVEPILDWKERIDTDEEKIGEKVGINVKELRIRESEDEIKMKQTNYAPNNVPDELSCKGGCGFYSLPESLYCSVCVSK